MSEDDWGLLVLIVFWFIVSVMVLLMWAGSAGVDKTEVYRWPTAQMQRLAYESGIERHELVAWWEIMAPMNYSEDLWYMKLQSDYAASIVIANRDKVVLR